MIPVPQAAIELAKRFEGFHRVPRSDPQRRAHPYICPAGYWTIGYGRLCKPDVSANLSASSAASRDLEHEVLLSDGALHAAIGESSVLAATCRGLAREREVG